jgi:NAD(P)H dehydrogenase (quinone)
MYAITGITGQVGNALAQSLLAAGQRVRAVVRDRNKGAAWQKRGADMAVAELSDGDALVAAFGSADGVFILLPPQFDPTPGFPESRRLIESLRAALERARPRKVVALSTIGADAPQPNVLNALRLMEQSFASLPMPVVDLRAAWFMENAAWDIAAASSGTIHSFLQPLDRPIAMISTEDVGRTAATLLQEDFGGQRIVELESARRVSPNDLSAAFAKALGHPVRAEAVPRAQWEGLFRAQGIKNPLPRMQMLDGFNEGWIDFTGRNADARKGTIDIDQAVEALVKTRQAPTTTTASNPTATQANQLPQA